MASLWQKKGGTWCVSYWEHGKQRVRSLRTKDRREALKLKRAIEMTLDDQGAVVLRVSLEPKNEPKNPEMNEFWRDFENWAHAHRARRTVAEYRNWFVQLQTFTGAQRMGDISGSDIENFKASLRVQGKKTSKGVGLKRRSINNGLKTLKAIWSHAIKLGLYTGENPAARAERYQLPQQMDRDYLEKEQVQKLLNAALAYRSEKYVRRIEATNIYFAIALMALAGLRKGEACFARWEWIDFENRTITVDNDEHFTTKNRQPRVISMNRELMEILQLNRRTSGYVLENVRASECKTGYRADFKKGFQRVCELAGIDTTPHQLRHSFASRHAVAGTSLHVIAGWLGHSTTWVTERYAHFQKTFNAAADNI